ncbi:ABC transporter permease [Candidatus Caldatribacterium sp.]|uniref:ABC transporter permease n=1 Tax=Candidatus Caldatribacterium sp. TaxID=2282143 RepID=UPI002994219F|nr:ABC transporter permease [Candidatus Caldatribacterium sp.]MDW8081067.1 ABC transporter permease [Candidatus Calescibacterium sp.]
MGLESIRVPRVKSFSFRWEWLLFVLILGAFFVNVRLSPYFWNYRSFMDALSVFLEAGFMVFPMVMVLVAGDIDISVASITALSSVLMALAHKAGLPMGLAILVALGVGVACGYWNGFLISRVPNLSAIIVTLAGFSIYRGIAYILLGDKAVSGFPSWYSYLAWGYVGNTGVPFMLVAFLGCALVYGLVLHRTAFGRKIFAIGTNRTAAFFSGVPVARIRQILFTLNGLMAGVAAVFLTSKLGSSRPNVATGYELEVIAIAVLGGASPSGGKGSILGACLALVLMRLLRYGMGLRNIPGQVMMVVIGVVLIGVVMIPNLVASRRKRVTVA